MSSLDFFAAGDDLMSVFAFLFEQTDVRVFEHYSALGQELREFHSPGEAAAACSAEIAGKPVAVHFHLWSLAVMPQLEVERITLNPDSCGGHTFRYTTRGGGMIQLYVGAVDANARSREKTHFGHNSQARARSWGVDGGVDWVALSKLSNRIQYHVRRRLAVAHLPGRPVLSRAQAMSQQGYALREANNAPWRWDLETGALVGG
jgi:hypothetical protein